MDGEYIFYKFCKFNGHTEKNVKKHQLYPCLANNENDPFEVMPYFNKVEWINFFVNTKKKYNAKVISSGINDYIKEFLDDIRSRVKIFSLCKTKDNLLLWSHYADGHKGICIEYDLTEYIKTATPDLMPKPVCYNDNRIEWDVETIGYQRKGKKAYVELVLDTFNRKSRDWEYEQEYRISIINEKENSDCIIDAVKIKSIIIGALAPVDLEDKIKKIVKENPDIVLYKAYLDNKLYKLNFKKIN